MNSMTGYGKATVTEDGKEIDIEIKTVNGRFLETNIRSPKNLSAFDSLITKAVSNKLKRGSVDINLNYRNTASDKKILIDLNIAKEYVAAAKKLRTEFVLDEDFQTTALLRSPDVIQFDTPAVDIDSVKQLAMQATSQALEQVVAMRKAEGKELKSDILKHLADITKWLEQIIVFAPKVIVEYRSRLQERIKDFLGDVPIEEMRLINEVAIFADKGDISEEISRLTSHIKQFYGYTDNEAEPMGKQMDFILQEMHRETNTMSSKTRNIDITKLLLEIKNSIEKIKEQCRNIE